MNKQKFIELVENPSLIRSKDADILSDLVRNYPYASLVRSMLAKASKGTYAEKETLATAALYIPDRKVLKAIIENSLYEATRQAIPSPSEAGLAEAYSTLQQEREYAHLPEEDPREEEAEDPFAEPFVAAEVAGQKEDDTQENEWQENEPQENDRQAEMPEVAMEAVGFPSAEEKAQEQEREEKQEKPLLKEESLTFDAISLAETPTTDEVPQQAQVPHNVIDELQENLRQLREQRERFNQQHGDHDGDPQAEKDAEREKEAETTADTETKAHTELDPVTDPDPATEIETDPNSKENAAAGEQTGTESLSSEAKLNLKHLPERLREIVDMRQELQIRDPKRLDQINIINSFINNGSAIVRKYRTLGDEDEKQSDLSNELGFTPDELVTENLAQIMVRQGKHAKAIDIYEKLVLKYPQKRAYFASCIEKLKTSL